MSSGIILFIWEGRSTAGNGITKPLGAGTATEQVVDGAAPYWRLALEQRWKNHFFTIGTYGMQADIFPAGNSRGPSDRFADVAFDAQYQYMGTMEVEKTDTEPMVEAGKTMITAHATWIHENQEWKASFPLGKTANSSSFLNTFRMNFNYYYRSRLGDIAASIGYFSTTGGTDPLLYSYNPVDGSRAGSPNSSGLILAADYRPWDKIRISFQYIIYNKFNGANLNYDGFGRNASDNNTLYVLVWIMF
jgi:hypothetical protein